MQAHSATGSLRWRRDRVNLGAILRVTRRAVSADESRRATRQWWDLAADDYQREHGAFLGSVRWVWGPEGLDEATAGLLGPVAGRDVLELGCGAAAGSRWLQTQGSQAIGLDLSMRQLQHSRRLDVETQRAVPVVVGDAEHLPFGSDSFDVVASAYGALPFVADAAGCAAEVGRVLREGGRWVFSVTHPMRWCFPDVGGESGLVAERPYFDRRAYVEQVVSGGGIPEATYVEHHRTVGDWVELTVEAGFRLVALLEPEWPADNTKTWGGWSPLRGRMIPGTLIVIAEVA